MRDNIQAILHKELSRREFLKLFAGMIAMIIGIPNLIAYLHSRPTTPSSASKLDTTSHGFGARKFGK